MRECRVYANRGHVSLERSAHVNELCNAIWSDGSRAARVRRFGSRARGFAAGDTPQEADRWVLPLFWNYYLEHDAIPLAEHEAQLAAQAGHSLIVFSQGDFTANLPFKGATLFERSTYASRRGRDGNQVYALPVFIPDYVEMYCHSRVRIREKGIRPVVGFCGQAGGSQLDFARRDVATRIRRAAYRLRLRRWEPPPFETTRLRTCILGEVARHPGLQPNFVMRRRYRAGYLPERKDPFHPTRMEFIENILNSDYTVCIRGAGNFSARFYETLALGRIPVLVNTDCVLPYDEQIDYRQYCVWVEPSEIPQIGEIIIAFHESLSAPQFRELQAACYSLWCKWLSMDGFYANFARHFSISFSNNDRKDPSCV